MRKRTHKFSSQEEKEIAQLWYENMLLKSKINEETALIWYEIMMGGM